MGNFDYFKGRLPFADAAADAENVFNTSFPLCSMSCRRALEIAVKWVYEKEPRLKYNDQSLSDLIYNEKFKGLIDDALFKRVKLIIRMGNSSAHEYADISRNQALDLLRSLFLFYKWVDSRYTSDSNSNIQFDSAIIPDTETDQEILSHMISLVDKKESEIRELTEKNKAINTIYAKERARNLKERRYNPAELTEFETRKNYIDMDLLDCGWTFAGPTADVVEEFKLDDIGGVSGEIGFADYVLFGKDGLPLAVIEAKKTSIDPRVGRDQVRAYVDSLERRYNRRPMMFMTNGFTTIFWDDVTGPERSVSGVFSKGDLQKLMDRRLSHSDPMAVPIDGAITDRYYQMEAIRAVCHDINEGVRKHLIVMATGTGKTRTASSLVDILSKAGLITNVLFLADRNVLVDQAKEDFDKYLPHMLTCNLCETKHNLRARIVFSTYQTIINVIDQVSDGDEARTFTPAHFDLIIIDESHRSIFRKYRTIFEYFDSMILGLTATPKTEVVRNTYDFFQKDDGIPTYAYDYETAVNDHWLVPYYNYEVKTKIIEDGITYDSLSDSDKERYEDDFAEDGEIPEVIPSNRINTRVFNENTIDMVIQDLMERGIKIDGGDHIGKSIIFATNRNHANIIKKRFDALYPQFNGKFAAVVVHDSNNDKYQKKTIWDFKYEHSLEPQIVISVDMMDTGVDVRDCVNLVFFKKVRSKVKFWQMIGRGTRPYPEGMFSDGIDGSYEGKRRFLIFDYCGNFEFFRENTNGYESADAKSISHNIFEKCVMIIQELQKSEYVDDEYQAFRQSIVDLCHKQVMALNADLASVRLKREYVDKYRNIEVFQCLSESDSKELISEIAPLVIYDSSDEYSKYFDNLMYSLILTALWGCPNPRLQTSLTDVATRLKDKASIPQVRGKMKTIQTVLSDEFWIDSRPLSFESVRQELRDLMQFLERESIRPIVTDITDTIIEYNEGGGSSSGYDFKDYRMKVNQYINSHKDEGPIYKINHNLPLDANDVSELMRIFTQELGSEDDYSKEYGTMDLGVMIRKMVKLDHGSTMAAFSKFINDSSLNQQQIQFVYKLIQYVENEGVIDIQDLQKSPFDRPVKITSLFNQKEMGELIDIVRTINANATVKPLLSDRKGLVISSIG